MAGAQRDLRQDEELVTRFFAYGDGLNGYEDRVSPFLYAYTKRMNAAFAADPALVESYRVRFQQTMQFVQRHFPFGFRRMAGGTSTPKARFEAIAVGTYLALSESIEVAEQQAVHVPEWISEKPFRTVAGSGSANAIGKLRGSLGFVRDKLLGR